MQALDTSKIVDMAGCRDKVAPSDFEIWSRNPASLVFVNDISLSGSGVPHVQLTLNPHSCLVSTTVDVPVNVQGEWPALSR